MESSRPPASGVSRLGIAEKINVKAKPRGTSNGRRRNCRAVTVALGMSEWHDAKCRNVCLCAAVGVIADVTHTSFEDIVPG
jgi:hypothetical protein